MNLILHWTNHYAEMMMGILRCIVLMELCQNAWSFAVVGSQNSEGREGATLLQKARRGQIAIPWRRLDNDKDDAHVWLEDEFLDTAPADEMSNPSLDFDLDVGRYQLEEDSVDPVHILTTDYGHGSLDSTGDEDISP